MKDSFDEIIARHDAATACGCSCCDDDFSAYVEQSQQAQFKDRAGSPDAPDARDANRRRSVRYVFETLFDRPRTTKE